MVKESKDYIEEVQKQFPEWSKKELLKIIDYGLKAYVWANKKGCDFKIVNTRGRQSSIYTGHIYVNKKSGLRSFKKKSSRKERALYQIKKEKYDGYYYIGLTDEENSEVRQRGRNHKYIFKNVTAYKLKRELYHRKYIKHIWRIPYPLDCGWEIRLDRHITNDAEYVGPNLFEKYHKDYNNGTSK